MLGFQVYIMMKIFMTTLRYSECISEREKTGNHVCFVIINSYKRLKFIKSCCIVIQRNNLHQEKNKLYMET